jgi:hypothetical protein
MNRREVLSGAAATVAAGSLPAVLAVPSPDIVIGGAVGAVYCFGAQIAVDPNWVWHEIEWVPITPK